jgi:LemA protein
MISWIIIGVIVFVGLTFFVYYNKFVRLSHQIDNSIAQIDVQLKKRADLVPNLIETVKGYVKHEKGIITEVTNARKALIAAKTPEKKMAAGAKLQGALKDVFAVAENYPNLKANENFLELQRELASIEDKVAYARQYYNDGIMSYNVSVHTIPGKWFASLYGFSGKKYLEIPAEQKAVPKVSF